MKTLMGILISGLILFASCSDKGNVSAKGGSSKPENSTYIADRTIKGYMFLGVAAQLPDDQINNAVAKKIKELTGITMEWTYITGNSNLEAMVTTLASGDLPDVIVSHLTHSGRPEFPVLLKAAREGMFADVVPYFKKAKVYSKYLDPAYLPYDSYHNIFMREEFNGSAYIVNTEVTREPGDTREDSTRYMFINGNVARALGIEPKDVKTMDGIMKVAQMVKDSKLADAKGKKIVPIGPTIYEGRREQHYYKDSNFSNNRDGIWGVYEGKVKHVAGTPLFMKQIERIQNGVKAGLIDPEIFTMTKARAQEAFLNQSFAMMVMNILDAANNFEKTGVDWIPFTNIEDWEGRTVTYVPRKRNYRAWAISANAKNPEEIVKFADFLASYEGKLIWQYGIEGETYEMDANNQPLLKKEVYDLFTKDYNAGMQLNLGALDSHWGKLLGHTDIAQYKDFGEYTYGEKLSPEKSKKIHDILNYGNPVVEYYDGTPPSTFLNDMPQELQISLKQFIEPKYHFNVFVQACFAKDLAESKKICDEYRALLEKQGILEFEEYLTRYNNEHPGAISFNAD